MPTKVIVSNEVLKRWLVMRPTSPLTTTDLLAEHISRLALWELADDQTQVSTKYWARSGTDDPARSQFIINSNGELCMYVAPIQLGLKNLKVVKVIKGFVGR